MTGVKTPPRMSSSTRARSLRSSSCTHASRSPVGRTGAAMVLALAAASCASELADGNATGVPEFGANGNGGAPGSNLPPGVIPPGMDPNNPNGPGSEDLPPVVVNSQANRNPSISGTGDTGPPVDANGNPLPVDQLPALRDCSPPGPQIIRRLTSQQYTITRRAAFGRDDGPSTSPLRDATTLGYNVDSDDSLIEGLDAQSLMTLG